MAAATGDDVNIRFGATISDLLTKLAEVVSAVKGTTQAVAAEVSGPGTQAFNGFGVAVDALGPKLADVGTAVSGAGATIATDLSGRGSQALDTLSVAVDGVAGKLTSTGDAAEAAAGAVTDALGGQSAAAIDGFASAVEGAAQGTATLAESADAAGSSIADGIGGAGAQAFDSLGTAVDGITARMPELGDAARGAADAVGGELGGSAGAFETFGARAAASIDGVTTKLGDMLAFMGGVASGIKAEFGDQASAAFGSFGSNVRQKIDEITGSFKSVAEAAQQELVQRAGAAFGVFGRDAARVANLIISKWGSLPPLFRSVATAVVAAGAVIAAGLAGKKFADENAEMIESTRDLARAIGVTTNEASVMRAVFDDVGASQGEYEGAAKGLVRQLKANEETMKRAGLVTRDAAGDLRPLNAMTLDAIKLLNTYKEGTDRATASRQIFGRGIDASSRLLLINAEAVEENRKAVAELGLEVGQNAVEGWKDYDAASDRAGLTLKAFGKAIAESVLPVVTELTEWFNNIAPAAITVFRGALGGLATAFLSLTNGVRVVWEVINAMVISVAEPIRGLAEGIGRAMVGDFAGAATVIKSIPGTITGAWQTAFDKIEKSSEKTRERIGRVWAFATGADKKPGDSGSPKGDKTAKPDEDKKAGGTSTQAAELALQRAGQEAALALELEYLRQAQAIYDDAHDKKLISIGQFYDARLAIELRGIDATLAVRRKEMADAEKSEKDARAAAGKAAPEERDKADAQAVKFKIEQVKLLGQINILEAQRNDTVRRTSVDYENAERQVTEQIATIRANRARDSAQSEIDIERSALDQMVALRQISGEAALEQQAALEQRSYAIVEEFLAAKRALLQDGDETGQEQQFAEEEAAYRTHQQRMSEIAQAAERERARYSQQAQQEIQGGFKDMVAGMLNGVTKMGDLLRNFAQSVTNTFVNLIAQKFTDKLFEVSGVKKAIDSMVNFFVDGIGTMVTKWFGAEQAKSAAAAAGATTRQGIAVAEAGVEKGAVLGAAAVTEIAEVAKTGAVVAGAGVRTTTEVGAAATSKSLTIGDAIMSIGAKAWQAAASVYASIAAIPFVGPFLAPAAAIGAAAVVLGFVGRIASSEGGEYRVDQDRLNIVHKDETILPAPFAQGLRELVGTGGASPLIAAADMIVERLAPPAARRPSMAGEDAAPGAAGPSGATVVARAAQAARSGDPGAAAAYSSEGAIPVPAAASTSLAPRPAPADAPVGQAGQDLRPITTSRPDFPAVPVPADAAAALSSRGAPTVAPVEQARPLAPPSRPLAPEARPIAADASTSLILAPAAPGLTATPPPVRAQQIAASGEATTPAPERATAKALAAAELPTRVGLSAPEIPQAAAKASTPQSDVGKLVIRWMGEEQNKPLAEGREALSKFQSVAAGQPAEQPWWRVPSNPLGRIQAQATDGAALPAVQGGAEGRRGGAALPAVQLVGASAGDFFITNRKHLLKVLADARRDLRGPT